MIARLGDALRPSRAELVDVGTGCLLAVLGVIGFRTTFAGAEEVVVGVPAVLAGAAVGYALVKLRVPLLVGVALATVAFFLLGAPLAVRHRAVAGFLPSPDAVSGLADGVINGWIRLLTTLPPAGEAGDLVAVPYLCGFAGGALTVVLGLRFPARSWGVLPPTAVLVVSVLMGTKQPASLLLQGVAFAALTIAWVAARHHRRRVVTTTTSGSRGRLATAAGLLAVSAVGGFFVGPLLPGADTDERYVLRDDVEPPFDPLTEPSPLAAYRNYTDQDVREDRIVTVTGLPAGAHLRIAAMDAYSGTEWEATGDGSVVAGEYLRVGAKIPAEVDGFETEVGVEVHKPHGVWVPLAGDVTSLDFLGGRGPVLDDEVRVSMQTDTAAVPRHLAEGDRYRFTARFVELPDEDVLHETPLDSRFRRVEDTEVPTEFVGRAAEWAREQPTAYAEMAAIAEGLRTEGAYTDGGEDANPVSPPGHSLRRLLDFIAIEQPFGNGEQFAAAQGLMARALGVPVRVVMGFVNETGDDEVTFRGEDIAAWIEVPVTGLGWVPIDGTPPEDQLPDPMKQPRSKTDNPEPQPPPPTTVPPPTSIPDELDPQEPDEEDEEDDGAGGVPGWLLAAVAAVAIPAGGLGLPALLVVGLKRRRRARRRTRGTPSERVAGSFAELVDDVRDLGRPVPPRATRRELAAVVGALGAPGLADRADRATFGAGDTGDADVDAAWSAYEEARAALHADLDRATRLRAAVSITSLRGGR